MIYKRILKMSDDSELYQTLQKAILNLHDVKPKHPIRFLVDYFSFECEDDPFAAAINLFDSLTIFHPVTEERIAKCYDILSSSGEFQGALVGAQYNKFIMQLLIRLDVPLELRKPIIDYLYRGSSPVVSCHILRCAILTVLLYSHYFEEMLYVFDNLIVSPNVAPAYKCEDLLIHASICLRNIHALKEYPYPYTLGIRTFCDPEYEVSRTSSKNSFCEEFWDRRDFMMAAKETFFHAVDDLSLSRFRLLELINYGYENEQYQDESDEEHDGDEHDEDYQENNDENDDHENNDEDVVDHENDDKDEVEDVHENNKEDKADHENNKEDED